MTSQRADELSDEQLVTRLGGPGVEVAISELYDRYSRTVYGVGLKILGERSLAEELIQEPVLCLRRGAGGLAEDHSRPGHLRLFRVGLTCFCLSSKQGTTGTNGVKSQVPRTMTFSTSFIFPANHRKRRADERTRTADLLITSVRSVVAESCRGLQIPYK